VRQQVFDQYRLPGGGGIWEVFRDAVIERDFAFFDEHHDGGRDELFADGAGLHQGLGLDRHIELDVSKTVSLGEQDAAATVDAKLEAGNALAGHVVIDEIVKGGEVFGVERYERTLRERGRGAEEKRSEQQRLHPGAPF